MARLENQVFPLLRACADPASRTATNRRDHPGCQIVTATMEKDMGTGAIDNTMFLAAGMAIAGATVLELGAVHRGVRAPAFIDALDRGRPEEKWLMTLLRSFFAEDGPTPPDVLGQCWESSQDEFYDLIVQLGDFAATLIDRLTRRGAYTEAEILLEIVDALGDEEAG
ncbi:hypothetical protein LN042_10980 [Kitasatospora sp. RB6PN24]|uniref:hypothetical protein n=1 Tax=Kitasatospora humi TaxID=2893891 RepID=UPI001E4443E9|nr:hypothetical protein [Kitasatospora humi]MCC9307619.1 hypothetical protein [Kitasatospora humi]